MCLCKCMLEFTCVSLRACLPFSRHACGYDSTHSDVCVCVCVCVCVFMSQGDETSGETTVYLTCLSPDGGGSF